MLVVIGAKLQKVLEVKVKTFFFLSFSLIGHHIDPQLCVLN